MGYPESLENYLPLGALFLFPGASFFLFSGSDHLDQDRKAFVTALQDQDSDKLRPSLISLYLLARDYQIHYIDPQHLHLLPLQMKEAKLHSYQHRQTIT